MPFDNTPEVVSQVVLDLIAVRQYLDTNGWCQHHVRWGVRRCLVGAMYEVAGAYNISTSTSTCDDATKAHDRSMQMQILIADTLHSTKGRITEWNDDRKRTYNDVRQVLDRTIEQHILKENSNAV